MLITKIYFSITEVCGHVFSPEIDNQADDGRPRLEKSKETQTSLSSAGHRSAADRDKILSLSSAGHRSDAERDKISDKDSGIALLNSGKFSVVCVYIVESVFEERYSQGSV